MEIKCCGTIQAFTETKCSKNINFGISEVFIEKPSRYLIKKYGFQDAIKIMLERKISEMNNSNGL